MSLTYQKKQGFHPENSLQSEGERKNPLLLKSSQQSTEYLYMTHINAGHKNMVTILFCVLINIDIFHNIQLAASLKSNLIMTEAWRSQRNKYLTVQTWLGLFYDKRISKTTSRLNVNLP